MTDSSQIKENPFNKEGGEDEEQNWKVYRFGKLWSLKNIPKEPEPIEWIVHNIIPKRSLSMFYGMPGHAKSLVVMDMCMCAASGHNWLGRDEFWTGKTKVLWFDIDMGTDVMNERLIAMHNVHKAPNMEFLFYSFPTRGLNLSTAEHTEDTIRLVEELGAELVVFDTFKRVAACDENSSEIDVVLGSMRRIISETGCSIIAIHHSNKGHGEGQIRIRGSTAIAGGVDNGYHVDYIQDIVESARHKITQEKCRRGEPLSPVEFKIVSQRNAKGATVRLNCEPYFKEEKWRRHIIAGKDDELEEDDWEV